MTNFQWNIDTDVGSIKVSICGSHFFRPHRHQAVCCYYLTRISWYHWASSTLSHLNNLDDWPLSTSLLYSRWILMLPWIFMSLLFFDASQRFISHFLCSRPVYDTNTIQNKRSPKVLHSPFCWCLSNKLISLNFTFNGVSINPLCSQWPLNIMFVNKIKVFRTGMNPIIINPIILCKNYSLSHGEFRNHAKGQNGTNNNVFSLITMVIKT